MNRVFRDQLDVEIAGQREIADFLQAAGNHPATVHGEVVLGVLFHQVEERHQGVVVFPHEEKGLPAPVFGLGRPCLSRIAYRELREPVGGQVELPADHVEKGLPEQPVCLGFGRQLGDGGLHQLVDVGQHQPNGIQLLFRLPHQRGEVFSLPGGLPLRGPDARVGLLQVVRQPGLLAQ